MLSLQRKPSNPTPSYGDESIENHQHSDKDNDIGIGEMDSEVVVKGKRSSIKNFLHSVSSPKLGGPKVPLGDNAPTSSTTSSPSNESKDKSLSSPQKSMTKQLSSLPGMISFQRSSSSSSTTTNTNTNSDTSTTQSPASNQQQSITPPPPPNKPSRSSGLRSKKGSKTSAHEFGMGIGESDGEMAMSAEDLMKAMSVNNSKEDNTATTEEEKDQVIADANAPLSPMRFWSRKTSSSSSNGAANKQ